MPDTEEVAKQKIQEEEEENTEEFTFDHTLKKKKANKSKVTFKDDEQNDDEKEKKVENQKTKEQAGTEEKIDDDDDEAAIFDNMKKKKKKKPVDKDKAEEVVVDDRGEVGDLSSTKKKRKKKTADLADFEKQLKEDDDEKSDEDIFAQEAEQNETEVKEIKEEWHSSNRDYLYQELLRRVFQILRQNNPELAGEKKKRYTIVPPSVHRDGNKKTIFANVSDICKRMHRQPEHVIQFLFAELGTSGSIDGMQRLVIKGRFQQKQIENVLRRYIVEYVTCKTCKSPDTILTKENRIFFQQCESCGSTRSVSAIKTGFKAQTEKRAAQRRAVQ